MRRKILNLILILSIFFGIAGCNDSRSSKEEIENKWNLQTFDTVKAQEIANKYMMNIQTRNFEEAKTFCSDELKTKLNEENLNDDMRIIGYINDEFYTVGDGMTIKYLVSKNKKDETKGSLDIYTIKLQMKKDELDSKNEPIYQIKDIIGSNMSEAFVDGNTLKIINSGDVEASNVISLKDLPKSIYVNSKKTNIQKENVPNDKFSIVSFSVSGGKIAITSTDDTNSFIGIVELDKAIQTGGKDKEDTKEGSSIKRIGKKITSLDVYKNAKIKETFLSQNDSYLAVKYIDNKGDSILKVYDVPKSKLIDTNFGARFPESKYNVEFVEFFENFMVFEVYGKGSNGGFDKTLLGKYKINLDSLKIDKI